MDEVMNKRRKTEGISDCTSNSIKSESDIAIYKDTIDYFSHLPDDVITHVLYFLPMKETTRTCVLSKNLSRLWTCVPTFKLKDLVGHYIGPRAGEKVKELVEIVKNFLQCHDGPIGGCRVMLSSGCCIIQIRGGKTVFSIKEAFNVLDIEIYRNNCTLANRQEANHFKNNVLVNLLNVNSLSLTGWAFKCFAAGEIREEMPSSYLVLRKLELEVSSWNVKELNGMICLLKSCPSAEKFVLWINEEIADEKDYGNYEVEINDTESYWEELDDSFFTLYGCCMHNSLQWIEINNFTGLDSEVRIVKFFVSNTQWLRTMTINPTKEMDPRQQLGFANLFKRLPRSCPDTKVIVNQVKLGG